MKKIFSLTTTIALVSFMSCQKCEEVIFEPCQEIIPNSEHCGWTVATHYSAEQNGNVGVIYDTRFNSQAPKGDDWGTTTSAPQVTAFHPSNWTGNQIGQVFGIAIDDQENIYLASSDIYYFDGGFSGPLVSANIGRPFSAGQIFKCAPPTWNAVPFAVLPNFATSVFPAEPLNGTGNIAFDKWNRQLFATNLEDGKIYRIAMDGTIVETYDPWNADTGLPGIVSQPDWVWAIGVNLEEGAIKVYFPRITPEERSIYSVTLVDGAFPPAGSEILEISNVRGDQAIISDLAFSSDNQEMLVSERGDPHSAEVFSYSRSGSAWSFNQNYFVGRNNGENSAGGIDFAYTEMDGNVSAACDEYFWASGNYMGASKSSLGYIYGLEGISYAGNNNYFAPTPTANKDTDLFIDFDGLDGTGTKRSVGDVEVFDCYNCMDPCDLGDFMGG